MRRGEGWRRVVAGLVAGALLASTGCSEDFFPPSDQTGRLPRVSRPALPTLSPPALPTFSRPSVPRPARPSVSRPTVTRPTVTAPRPNRTPAPRVSVTVPASPQIRLADAPALVQELRSGKRCGKRCEVASAEPASREAEEEMRRQGYGDTDVVVEERDGYVVAYAIYATGAAVAATALAIAAVMWAVFSVFFQFLVVLVEGLAQVFARADLQQRFGARPAMLDATPSPFTGTGRSGEGRDWWPFLIVILAALGVGLAGGALATRRQPAPPPDVSTPAPPA